MDVNVIVTVVMENNANAVQRSAQKRQSQEKILSELMIQNVLIVEYALTPALWMQ